MVFHSTLHHYDCIIRPRHPKIKLFFQVYINFFTIFCNDFNRLAYIVARINQNHNSNKKIPRKIGGDNYKYTISNFRGSFILSLICFNFKFHISRIFLIRIAFEIKLLFQSVITFRRYIIGFEIIVFGICSFFKHCIQYILRAV